MELLKSQRNKIYELIEQNGLSPSMFAFNEDEKSTGERRIYILLMKNSEFFYRLRYAGSNRWSANHCPAKVDYEEYSGEYEWLGQMLRLNDWLKYVLRELTIPDRWLRLQTEMEGISITNDDDSDKFSFQEYEKLKQRVLILKKGIDALPLLPEQINVFNDKLDHLTEMAKTLNKFDWKSLFAGSIASLIIALSVTPENGKAIWELIKHTFSNFILN